MANIILTGIPRSGTTLLCHLLNKIPNAVALHEPMHAAPLAGRPMNEIVSHVEAFFDDQRRRILTEGKATSRAVNGKVPANHLSDEDAEGRRLVLITGDEIEVGNVDRPDFDLYIKHPVFFTACLPGLVTRIECFAMIRNPISVLLSWRAANMNVTHGRIPVGEAFDPELARALDSRPDILSRQLFLVDYFFRRYAEYLPDRIVRYEDMIATGGQSLAPINPAARILNEPLASRNARTVLKDVEARRMADTLIDSDNACWSFYRREDVENLFRNAI